MHIEAVELIRRFAQYNLAELRAAFFTKMADASLQAGVEAKLLSLSTDIERIQFIIDFQKASNVEISTLLSEGLFDVWATTMKAVNQRKSIDWLRIMKNDILGDAKLQVHAHTGEVTPSLTGNGLNATGCHNSDSFKGSPAPARYTSTPLYSRLGYAHGKIELKYDPSDLKVKANGSATKTKSNKSTTWREFDLDPIKNRRIINEEMASGYANKTLSARQPSMMPNGDIVKLYWGRSSDGMYLEIRYNQTQARIESIFPNYKKKR